jgi:hypothetical protein
MGRSRLLMSLSVPQEEVKAMNEPTERRPKNVVVVDADNPMVEVQGEFFWREDHDVLVAAARDEGYREGYGAGWVDAARQAVAPQTLILRRRLSLFARVRRVTLSLFFLVLLLIVLGTIAGQLIAQR